MVRSGDFLARFRPVGAPGPAAAAGVPVDRARELTAELGSVLDSLADTLAQAQAIREGAATEAARRRRDGDSQVEALLSATREQAQAQRAAVLREARAEAETAAAAVLEAARAEAAAVGDRVAARLPVMAEQVRAAVRADLVESPAGLP